MAAITDPLTITYGSRSVGGSTDYMLHRPYVIDKSHDSLSLVFTVVVRSSSYSDLQSSCDALETDFRLRDKNLTISIDGNTWTYTHGSNLLNSTASLQKSGNEQTDRGFSRSYICRIEAGLPADDNDGLRELHVDVRYESSRQKVVTMTGIYTAYNATGGPFTAVEAYTNDFDSEASTILTAIDNSATFELVDEGYVRDRNTHTCEFSRQYVELLANQSDGTLDNTYVRDHRLMFTDLAQHPGSGLNDVSALRRVVATYDCSVDIEQSTNPRNIYTTVVRPYLLSLFQTKFQPRQFGVETERTSTDETGSRISTALTIVYEPAESSGIVSYTERLAYRERRQIDYSWIHGKNELQAAADPGWAAVMRERTFITSYTSQTAAATARRRVGNSSYDVKSDGWNLISNDSESEKRWIGDPALGNLLEVVVVTDTLVEQYTQSGEFGNDKPGIVISGPDGRPV